MKKAPAKKPLRTYQQMQGLIVIKRGFDDESILMLSVDDTLGMDLLCLGQFGCMNDLKANMSVRCGC